MVDIRDTARIVESISALMTENRLLLVQLDQVNGDGDLGISMDEGFTALSAALAGVPGDDLGAALRQGAKVFNAAAPSSLGTIISFGLMGMARALKGETTAAPLTAARAVHAGVQNIMDKAESAPGQKTILDALHPGALALTAALEDGLSPAEATRRAAEAAALGSESTRQMRAVHGRAAYSADRSLGVLDGGSVAGKLIFEGIANATAT